MMAVRTTNSALFGLGLLATGLAGAALGGHAGPKSGSVNRQAFGTSKIAFARFPRPGARAYLSTITPNGSHLLRVIAQPDADLTEPTWSPDGRRIAYVAASGSTTNVCGIFLANALGRRPARVTRVQSDPKDLVLDAHPRWSPDGRRIVFHRWRQTGSTVFVVDVNGHRLRSLGNGYTPSWSPNGTRIAFAAKPPGSDKFNIYTMDKDGTNRHRLTMNPEGDTDPNWSPNGRQIAFEGTTEGNIDIYVMRADGTGRHRLTTAAGADTSPSWSPNGKKIVFASQRAGGGFDLYVMNADGTDQRRLSDLPGDEAQPSWRPEPRRVG